MMTGDFEQRRVALSTGVELDVVDMGPKDAPALIFLHGFPESHRTWRHQLPHFADRFRCIAPDQRGYRGSSKPQDAESYTPDKLIADIFALADALEVGDFTIVGHDWGGVIAWTFAMREPDYLRRLVVINAPHPATLTREWRHPGQWRRSAYVGFFQLPGVAENAITRDNYRQIWRTFRSADRGRAWLTDEDIQRFVDAMARPGAVTAALSYYRQLLRQGAATLGPARVIEAPALLLWGELDRYLGPWMSDNLEPWAPNLRVRRFPTAGHWLNQQFPEAVNDELLAFLEEADT
jgi:pimeloyl-ACP methyl ester carboxylesterase